MPPRPWRRDWRSWRRRAWCGGRHPPPWKGAARRGQVRAGKTLRGFAPSAVRKVGASPQRTHPWPLPACREGKGRRVPPPWKGGVRGGSERTAFLQSLGWRVIRFWNSEVSENPEGVAEAIIREVTATL
ncbi:MAG TPA: DUF559 domain-containing protein [Allosphingosinicella sp.]